jgi:hypothetical protein
VSRSEVVINKEPDPHKRRDSSLHVPERFIE